MNEERAGHWVEKPLLVEVAAPPPAAIETHGAALVRIFGPDGPAKTDAGREAVVLARAKMPGGPWAILVAWARHWAYEQPPHQTERAERGWYLYEKHRVQPRRPPRVLYEGACWHGWHEDGELNRAIREAVASLPEHLREAAIQPAQEQGPAGE